MRFYSVPFTNITGTGPKTLAQIKAGAATPVQLIACSIGQVGSTTSTQYIAEIVRKSAAATVTSQTPLLLSPNDGAAQAVGGVSATGINASAEGTDGDILWQEGPNILGSWVWQRGRVGQEEIWVAGGGIIALKIVTGTVTSVYGNVIFGEPN